MPALIDSRCPSCSTELAAGALVCPGCAGLIHCDRLTELASKAQGAVPSMALPLWREALSLLPPGSEQHRAVTEKIAELGRTLESSPAKVAGPNPAKPKGKAAGLTGVLGVLAAILFKSKGLLLLLLTKGKLLLLGLTKMSTLLTMFASFGLYWTMWGWKFTAGFVGSIYVHEMGHVAALRKLGIRATAPMFIPGVGAVVRLQEQIATPVEDARVGLAGPIWGLGAAAFAWFLAYSLQSPMWDAIAQSGAWINLFNLTPIWQLDGARAFHALDRTDRVLAIGAVLAAFMWTREGMLLLLIAFGVYQLFTKNLPSSGDRRALVEYVTLVGLLSMIAYTRVAPGAIGLH